MSQFPAPIYAETVLGPNFEDAKKHFLDALLEIHYAHTRMLAAQGILTASEERLLLKALDGLDREEIARARYDGSCEDLFFFIEGLLRRTCGDLAGKMHTARSRNDIDMVLYRMRQRELVLALLDATMQLRDALIEVAGRNRDTIFPAHTHTQPAQPSTIAHYLLAVIEQLERDASRLRSAHETTNRCPLGACAITGTGFDIDRQLTSDLLGFLGPTGNTYGSIATVDYLLQNVSAAMVALAGFGRFVQDLLQWCTIEFGYLRLGDGFVQPSSIMPQKRNPVSVEHARSIASRAMGETLAVMVAVHNTPFGDIVDTEDDLQPVVFAAFWDGTRAINLLAAAIRGAEFDRAKLEARAAQNGITLTELADVLARGHGVPFQVAHRIVAELIRTSQAAPERPLVAILAEVSAAIIGAPIRYTDETLGELLSPRHFVEVRRTLGGPAPSETGRALDDSRQALAADRRWMADTRAARAAASERLLARRAAL